ncbi:DUF2878 domain-containing protein [Oceanicoccus sp. KOV_DT_Chl]|uniref:DUF2878 domain-containing protein n=1 Tax=Oceanicoccus sp. KOV_DT_Chl TaxID=1904639 RepID=UPI000C7A9D41|nr:DUF2878 domain-containing protein [Oceanicoccus sp. KOV_DT_Chl]
MNKPLINAALFQLGWFACVLGGDAIAVAALLVVLAIHYQYFSRKPFEWLFIAGVGLTGLAVDTMMAWSGVMQFEFPSIGLIPIWLLCLWIMFALTLNHSLQWLQSKLWLAALLGGVSGPMSYLAGSKLAPVSLLDPVAYSLLPISLCWALLLPLMFYVLRSDSNE